MVDLTWNIIREGDRYIDNRRLTRTKQPCLCRQGKIEKGATPGNSRLFAATKHIALPKTSRLILPSVISLGLLRQGSSFLK